MKRKEMESHIQSTSPDYFETYQANHEFIK